MGARGDREVVPQKKFLRGMQGPLFYVNKNK